MMILGLLTGLTACGGDDGGGGGSPDTPKVTVSVRSCSITNGAEYTASELTQVTISYNTVVAVSSSANITLNGTVCNVPSATVKVSTP